LKLFRVSFMLLLVSVAATLYLVSTPDLGAQVTGTVSISMGSNTTSSTYDLTISVSPSSAGSTSPSVGVHSYAPGTPVSVTATASVRYTFSHWTLDGVNVGSVIPYTVTMNAAHALTAVFATSPPPPPPVTTTTTATTSQCVLDAPGNANACGQVSAGTFSGLTAVAVSSISIPPPAAAGTFPDGLFSFTVSGLSPGQTVTVTITLSSPLPAGTFSYWKFQGGAWVQFPSAWLDAARRVIILTFVVPAGSTSIFDPGGPAMASSVTTTTQTATTQTTTTATSTSIPELQAGSMLLAFAVGMTLLLSRRHRNWSQIFRISPRANSLSRLNMPCFSFVCEEEKLRQGNPRHLLRAERHSQQGRRCA